MTTRPADDTTAAAIADGVRLSLSLDRETEQKVRRVAQLAGIPALEHGKPEEPVGALAGHLARLHAISPPREDLACLPVPIQPPARALVARLRGALDTAGEPRPALEYVLAWINENAPPTRQLGLVHGDLGPDAIVRQDRGLVGICRWHMAHWGDPDEDIGSVCMLRSRMIGTADLAAFSQAYAEAAGRGIGADALRYWQIMAAARRATVAVLTGDRYRIGGEARLELALAGLSAARLEHAALEDVLAWRGGAGTGGPRWP